MAALAGQLALIATAVFVGAALYAHAVERPGALRAEQGQCLEQWLGTFRRSLAFQRGLAFAAAVLGLLGWGLAQDWSWNLRRDYPWFLAMAALLLCFVSTLRITPGVRRLMLLKAGPDARRVLKDYAMQQLMRVLQGGLALAGYALAIIRG